MGYVRTIFLCLAGAGLLLGYLATAGDAERLTWDGLVTIGLVMFWAGGAGVVLGLFISEVPEMIRGLRNDKSHL